MSLKELDSVLHFLHGQEIVDQNQTSEQFSHGQRSYKAISDTCVAGSCRMEPQKIGIVRKPSRDRGTWQK